MCPIVDHGFVNMNKQIDQDHLYLESWRAQPLHALVFWPNQTEITRVDPITYSY